MDPIAQLARALNIAPKAAGALLEQITGTWWMRDANTDTHMQQLQPVVPPEPVNPWTSAGTGDPTEGAAPMRTFGPPPQHLRAMQQLLVERYKMTPEDAQVQAEHMLTSTDATAEQMRREAHRYLEVHQPRDYSAQPKSTAYKGGPRTPEEWSTYHRVGAQLVQRAHDGYRPPSDPSTFNMSISGRPVLLESSPTAQYAPLPAPPTTYDSQVGPPEGWAYDSQTGFRRK